MNQTYSLFRSRTFWTLVVMSLLPVANAVIPVLPSGIQDAATIFLGLLAAYFHKDTAVSVGATN